MCVEVAGRVDAEEASIVFVHEVNSSAFAAKKAGGLRQNRIQNLVEAAAGVAHIEQVA